MNKYVTASTGMDVAIHALESYTNKPYNARPKIDDPKIGQHISVAI